MSDPLEDKALEEYLRRQSALSMGYRKVYSEAPPPELDRAIAARARRALKWLVPGIVAATIAITFLFTIESGITTWMHAMVDAEKVSNKIKQEQKEKAERDRLAQPVGVVIDAKNIAAITAKEDAAKAEELRRQQWLHDIEFLKQADKPKEAAEELRKYRAAYPDSDQ